MALEPDIRALGRTGGTEERICPTLLYAIRLAKHKFVTPYKIPLNILKAAWAGKVSRYAKMVQEAGGSVQLLPVPLSTLAG